MDFFAEIEIAPPRPQKILPPSEPLITGDVSPVRQKFYDMRGMAGDNPYTWHDARLFYRQAKFMEDFEDDFGGRADFSMHAPCFQRMGYERLRTYFTWRTAARRGVFAEIPLSYIFLYTYELLACVGTDGPASALAGLLSLRRAYAEKYPALDEYLPAWLKDFHVYYEAGDFSAFVEKNNLRGFYTLAFYEGGLAAWNAISSYDVEKSRFFAASGENAALLADCFAAAVRGLTEFCAAKNRRVKDLFFLTGAREIPWFPFRRAIFHPWLRQRDRRVTLPGGEIFVCENNAWTTSHTAPYAHKKDLAAFVIRKTESLVRDAAGYKTKISADVSALAKAAAALNSLGILPREIENTIENAAANFFREKNRVVVSVDTRNLEKIRTEADDITEKLIVEEVPGGVSPEPPRGDAAPLTPVMGGWKAFVDSLSDVELEALRVILCDAGKIKTFADSKGIMVEILADSINEKAADAVGDNVLDGDFRVYGEYAGELTAHL